MVKESQLIEKFKENLKIAQNFRVGILRAAISLHIPFKLPYLYVKHIKGTES
jgi:hypothetical protein